MTTPAPRTDPATEAANQILVESKLVKGYDELHLGWIGTDRIADIIRAAYSATSVTDAATQLADIFCNRHMIPSKDRKVMENDIRAAYAPIVARAQQADKLAEALTKLASDWNEYANSAYCQTFNKGMSTGLIKASQELEAALAAHAEKEG